MVIGQKTPQERQIVLAPLDNLIEIVARADRAADDKQERFGQRMRHPPALALVIDQAKMIRKNPQNAAGRPQAWMRPSQPILESDSPISRETR